MGKKDELIAEAQRLGVELDSNETIADLEAKIAAHKAAAEPTVGPGETISATTDEPAHVDDVSGDEVAGGDESEAEPTLKRHKINRGSMRRLQRALAEFQTSIDATVKEMDRQAYLVDDSGARVGEWSLVTYLKDVREKTTLAVNEVLSQ